MPAAVAATLVLIVAIMAGLTAWVAWLGRQSRCHVGGCAHCPDLRLSTHQHYHEYSSVDHGHDDRYSLTGHRHDSYYAPLIHEHQEYVTHEQLSRHIRWQGIIRTVFVNNSEGILYGILVGGILGALVGLVLDLTLPRSVFELHANTTYNVDGRQIDQVLTTYNVWPMFGIPLGCIVVGMLLGGITLWIVRAVRNRRQASIEETR